MIRKKVLGVSTSCATLLVRDTESDGELRVLKRINISSWDPADVKDLHDLYLTLQSVRIPQLVDICAVLLQGSFLNIATSYCAGGDLLEYVENTADAPIDESTVAQWLLSAATAVIEVQRLTGHPHRGVSLSRMFLMTTESNNHNNNNNNEKEGEEDVDDDNEDRRSRGSSSSRAIGPGARVRLGLPIPRVAYTRRLADRVAQGFAADRDYPPEVARGGPYDAAASDVWHIGLAGMRLLSARAAYTARSPEIRGIIAAMMEPRAEARMSLGAARRALQTFLSGSGNGSGNGTAGGNGAAGGSGENPIAAGNGPARGVDGAERRAKAARIPASWHRRALERFEELQRMQHSPRRANSPVQRSPRTVNSSVQRSPRTAISPARRSPRIALSPAQRSPLIASSHALRFPRRANSLALRSPRTATSPARRSPRIALSPAQRSPLIASSHALRFPRRANSLAQRSPRAASSPAQRSPRIASSPARRSPLIASSPAQRSPLIASSPHTAISPMRFALGNISAEALAQRNRREAARRDQIERRRRHEAEERAALYAHRSHMDKMRRIRGQRDSGVQQDMRRCIRQWQWQQQRATDEVPVLVPKGPSPLPLQGLGPAGDMGVGVGKGVGKEIGKDESDAAAYRSPRGPPPATTPRRVAQLFHSRGVSPCVPRTRASIVGQTCTPSSATVDDICEIPSSLSAGSVSVSVSAAAVAVAAAAAEVPRISALGSAAGKASNTNGNRRTGDGALLAAIELAVNSIRESIGVVVQDRKQFREILEVVDAFVLRSDAERHSARFNAAFANTLREMLGDEKMFLAAAPLCTQLVALQSL